MLFISGDMPAERERDYAFGGAVGSDYDSAQAMNVKATKDLGARDYSTAFELEHARALTEEARKVLSDLNYGMLKWNK